MFEAKKSKFLVDKVPDTERNLKVFGVGGAIILMVIWAIGAIFFNSKIKFYLLPCIATFFLVTGLYYRRVLRPVYNVWMEVAIRIGHVLTLSILFILFAFVITPIGLLRQLMGADVLGLKSFRMKDSYWKDKEPILDKSRYLKEF